MCVGTIFIHSYLTVSLTRGTLYVYLEGKNRKNEYNINLHFNYHIPCCFSSFTEISSVSRDIITNTSCYYVSRCLLDPLSQPVRGWHTSPWYNDLNISGTQMGHFANSKCEPCLQTRVNTCPSVHPDPQVEAKLVFLTKLRTADLAWVLSGWGDVTRMVIF